jgi:glycosyltransferase involved in cell wall biosynthesis
MTAPGWARGSTSGLGRAETRRRLGISEDALVIGLVGSLDWTDSVGYVYGLELVRAVRALRRHDVVACIVGDGTGYQRLREMAGADLGSSVLLPGRVPPAEVVDHLAIFDVASLPQSVDAVGSFRYTTKLSEYLAVGLPVITGEIPAAYDLDEGCFWRLPGEAPWSPTYIGALTELLEGLTAAEIAKRAQAARGRQLEPFDEDAQQRRMCAFVEDILAERSRFRSSHISG